MFAIAICGRPAKALSGHAAAHPGPVDVGVAVLAGVPLGCCAGPCLPHPDSERMKTPSDCGTAARRQPSGRPRVPHAHRRARRREACRPHRRRQLRRPVRRGRRLRRGVLRRRRAGPDPPRRRRAGGRRAGVPLRRGADRRADRPAAPDPLHRAELQRPRRRDRPGRAGRADPVHQAPEHARRPERRRTHPPRVDQDRLGGRARHRHRPADQLPGLGRGRPATRSPASSSSTTSASGRSRSSAAVSGARASPPRPSTRPVRGWSPRTRSPTSSRWTCGWTSTASAGRPATPGR